jgi:hypothetical protein
MMVQAARRLGAVAVLAGGAVHLQQYIVQNVWFYPAIGALFLLNVIGSGVVGLALLAPLDRVFSERLANAALTVLTAIALLISVASLVFLFISESSSLFGFSESGYRTPVVLAIIAEGATIVLLTPVLIASLARAFNRRSEPGAEQNGALGRRVVMLRPGK